MIRSKVGAIIGIFVFLIACSPSKEIVKIYPIQEVEISEMTRFGQDFINVDYRIYFTENIKRYWIDYWQEVNGEWQYVGNVVDDIPKTRAKRTIGVLENFTLQSPSRVKIRVRAYTAEAKNNVSGVTVKREHIFNVK